jgi:hypothetical protein
MLCETWLRSDGLAQEVSVRHVFLIFSNGKTMNIFYIIGVIVVVVVVAGYLGVHI